MFGAAEHHPAHISQVRQCATPSARRARQRVFTLPSGELALIVKPAMHGAGRIVLRYLQPWYKINGEIKDREPDIRRRIRQEKAVLVMDVLTAWRVAQRDIVHNGSATGKVLNYSLKRWPTFSCYLDDGPVAIETIGVKTRSGLRLGRKNWVFARSPPSGKRAAANMGLIQSARNNGHNPYACLKDVLTRLPKQRVSEIVNLLTQPALRVGKKCKLAKLTRSMLFLSNDVKTMSTLRAPHTEPIIFKYFEAFKLSPRNSAWASSSG